VTFSSGAPYLPVSQKAWRSCWLIGRTETPETARQEVAIGIDERHIARADLEVDRDARAERGLLRRLALGIS